MCFKPLCLKLILYFGTMPLDGLFERPFITFDYAHYQFFCHCCNLL